MVFVDFSLLLDVKGYNIGVFWVLWILENWDRLKKKKIISVREREVLNKKKDGKGYRVDRF